MRIHKPRIYCVYPVKSPPLKMPLKQSETGRVLLPETKFNKNTNFQHFFTNFFDFFFNPFFGIFELRWQCSKFWLRWINFIFSKWLSYSRFTKSVLPSSQVENVTAYHPSTIYICMYGSSSHAFHAKIEYASVNVYNKYKLVT